MLQKNLEDYSNLFKDYTELRVQKNTNSGISFNKGNLSGNYSVVTSGVSARVFRKGKWGFASHPQMDDQAIKKTIQTAQDNALFLGTKAGASHIELPKSGGKSQNSLATSKPRKTQNELIEFTGDS
jgi:TldD protein